MKNGCIFTSAFLRSLCSGSLLTAAKLLININNSMYFLVSCCLAFFYKPTPAIIKFSYFDNYPAHHRYHFTTAVSLVASNMMLEIEFSTTPPPPPALSQFERIEK